MCKRPPRPPIKLSFSDFKSLGPAPLLDSANVAPDQIGLVGFDNADWLALLKPKITVIDYPLYQFGATAIDLLIRKMRNGKSEDSRNETVIKLDTYLKIRESSIKRKYK